MLPREAFDRTVPVFFTNYADNLVNCFMWMLPLEISLNALRKNVLPQIWNIPLMRFKPCLRTLKLKKRKTKD